MTYMLQEETRCEVEGLSRERLPSPPFALAVEEGQDEVGAVVGALYTV